jgi:prepilin peptidase CpaA
MMLLGLTFSVVFRGWAGLGSGGLGLLVGGACLLPVYVLGGMGAGDLKMLAAIGAWVGAWEVFLMFLATALLGGVMGVAVAILDARSQGKRSPLIQALSVALITRSNPLQAGPSGSTDDDTQQRSAPKLPYAIPIGLGSCAVFAFRHVAF